MRPNQTDQDSLPPYEELDAILQELRRRGVVTLENKQLTILDEKGLERIAEFDDSYLYLDKRRL